MTETMLHGTFRFADGPLVRDREEQYTYTDDFFRTDARIADARLRTMSFVLCMASFPSTEAKDYDRVYRNAETLLSEIGFEDFCVNEDFRRPPKEDTLGILAAHKRIVENGRDMSVIAVGLRGADYGDEWADNILLGESGEATGFAASARILEAFLRQYLEDLGSKRTEHVKLWLTGYSRVAAVVNLVGAQIDRDPAAYHTRTEDLYVYTFECPAAAPIGEERVYPSIHNFLHPHDLVPYLAPRVWGFCRYGNDEIPVPKMADEAFPVLYEKVREQVAHLNPEMRYDPTDFQPVHLVGKDLVELRSNPGPFGKRQLEDWWYDARQDEFLEHFFVFMNRAGIMMGRDGMTEAENRRTFARFYQTSASDTAKVYLGASAEDHARMRKNIENVVDLDLHGARRAWFYLQLLRGRARNIRKLEVFLEQCMRVRAMKTKSGIGREQEVNETLIRVRPLVRYFLKCASVDAREHHFAYLPTLIHNLDRLVISHLPEVILAWLEVLEERESTRS